MSRPVVYFDVETPNGRNDRICSIGVIVEKDQKEIYRKSTLINPECEFGGPPVKIHHITPEKVITAPTFPSIWEEIKDFFEQGIVVAHNVSFDLSVLEKTLSYYNLPAPTIDNLCTLKLSRMFLNLDNFKLSSICESLGIQLNHHEAFSDANACREIMRYLSKFTDLNEHIQHGKKPCTSRRKLNLKSSVMAITEVFGIISAFVVDGEVDEIELQFMANWHEKHNQYSSELQLFNDVLNYLGYILEDPEATMDDWLNFHENLEVALEDLNVDDIDLRNIYFKGIITGTIANPDIKEEEILLLRKSYDFLDIDGKKQPYDRLYKALCKTHVDKEEVFEELNKIINPVLDVKQSNSGTIVFRDKLFCLSGNFSTGNKKSIEEQIRLRGGRTKGDMTTDVDFLIEGNGGNQSWKFENHGRKAQKALKFQQQGYKEIITTEDDLVKAFEEVPVE